MRVHGLCCRIRSGNAEVNLRAMMRQVRIRADNIRLSHQSFGHVWRNVRHAHTQGNIQPEPLAVLTRANADCCGYGCGFRQFHLLQTGNMLEGAEKAG